MSGSDSGKKRRRSGPHSGNSRRNTGSWRDGPSFLDATSSVAVSTFGARRLPELKALYYSCRTAPGSTASTTHDALIHERPTLASGGGKASSRHLRRRTTAIHSKKHRHRFPRGASASGADESSGVANANANANANENHEPPDYKGATRRSRRKKRSLLTRDRQQWLTLTPAINPTNEDNDPSSCQQNPKPKWLVTHLWHAKRFHTLSTAHAHSQNDGNINNNKKNKNKNKNESKNKNKIKNNNDQSGRIADATTKTNWNPDPFGGWTGIPLVHTNRGPRAALRLSQESSNPTVLIRDTTWEGLPAMLLRAELRGAEPARHPQRLSLLLSLSELLMPRLGTICPELAALLQQDQHHHHRRRHRLRAFLEGALSVEGTLHEWGAVPSGAIGPTCWRVVPVRDDSSQARTDNENNGGGSPSPVLGIEVRCHPSICVALERIVDDLLEANQREQKVDTAAARASIWLSRSDSNSETIRDPKTSPMAMPKICFRLYGMESMAILNRVAKWIPNAPLNSTLDASAIFRSQRQHADGDDPTSSSSSSLQTSIIEGTILHIDRAEIATHSGSNGTSTAITSRDLILIYRAPRPLDCAANRAVAGWEVRCHDPAFASALWLALVTYDDAKDYVNSHDCDRHRDLDPCVPSKSGNPTRVRTRGCCAIGLVEEAHLRLECEPPIPVFPRDYVDTHESQRYWKSATNTRLPSSSSSSSSWNLIRQLYEGGWGRVPVDKASRLDQLSSIAFRDLVDVGGGDSDDHEDGNGKTAGRAVASNEIVVVRGAFCQPFLDAIRGSCGGYEATSSSSTKEQGNQPRRQRRNRRSTRPWNQVVVAPPLSREHRISLGKHCRRLSSSMSLPAVLLVHIRAVDKGTIRSGMKIIGADADATESNSPMGTITTGGFSTSRGVCHGTGVVGAVRLLDYLTRCMGIATSNSDNPDKTDEEGTSIGSSTGGRILQCGRIVCLANGSQSLQLLVRVAPGHIDPTGSEHFGCEACLSVIL